MKLALIAPVKYLSYWGALTDYHMALTHLVLSNDEYAKHFWMMSNRGHYVILDNSVVELGSAVTFDDLIEAAEQINATEIILPDVLDNREATLKLAEDCLSKAWLKGLFRKYKFMVVPQGDTFPEFIQCYKDLCDLPGKCTIGIPKRLGRFFKHEETDSRTRGLGRYFALLEMERRGIINTSKPHHLLGIYDNPLEIHLLSKYNWIRGVDTQLPFWAASEGIRFHPTEGMLQERNNRSLTLEQNVHLDNDIVGHNILCMLRWAN